MAVTSALRASVWGEDISSLVRYKTNIFRSGNHPLRFHLKYFSMKCANGEKGYHGRPGRKPRNARISEAMRTRFSVWLMWPQGNDDVGGRAVEAVRARSIHLRREPGRFTIPREYSSIRDRMLSMGVSRKTTTPPRRSAAMHVPERYDASAPSDDRPVHPEVRHIPFLDCKEAVDTMKVDDILERGSFARLDDDIGINELKTQFLGKDDPHRRFARSGHAGEHDIGPVMHFGLFRSHGGNVRIHGESDTIRLIHAVRDGTQ